MEYLPMRIPSVSTQGTTALRLINDLIVVCGHATRHWDKQGDLWGHDTLDIWYTRVYIYCVSFGLTQKYYV